MQKILFLLLVFLMSCSEKKLSEQDISGKHTNYYYEKAFVFMDQNKNDSAFLYLNKAKDVFLKKNDSFGVAKSFVNMAIIQENEGDNFGSIETSLFATNFLNENNASHHSFLFCNYNNLGIASNNLKNYKDAEKFYERSQIFAKDSVDKLMLANNIAITYHNEKKYQKSIAIYKKLIESLGIYSKYYPKLLLNYSRSRWFSDKNYHPVSNYLMSEKLNQKYNDDWTKDAAYAYLSDFYLDRNNDSAKIYAEKMLDIAQKLNYPTDQLEALKSLIKITKGQVSQNYFNDYSRIQDSLLISQNKAKNQFALIRFESEKAKSENLILQQQKSKNEYRIVRQKIIIWLIMLSSVILGFFFFYRMKKRRQKLILESYNKLQQQRLDFSKKVHDVVANGIYEVMSTIENQKDIPKEKLLNKLELMYEKSRNLSYDGDEKQDCSERISALVNSFDNMNTKIIIIGNENDFWKTIDNDRKDELSHIIRELLINMKKHSKADQVMIRFSNEADVRKIIYSDNGIGLPENFVPKNGLSNVSNRVAAIGGKISFERNVSGGLKVSISL